MSHLPPTSPARSAGISAGPAVAAWVALLVALNLTVQPVVGAGAFLGLTLLALRLGQRRLVVLALVVGAGMLLAIPGLSLASGSWSFTFGPTSHWLPAGTPAGLLLAAASVLRVPAQVLAVALLVAVPAQQALLALARSSPRTALLAALATRSRVLLDQDARGLRDELRTRGMRFARPASLGHRLAALRMLASALVAGSVDRAFDTAAALHARGYGARRATAGPLRDPRLVVGRQPLPMLDRAMWLLATTTVGLAVAGRASGQLVPPQVQVFSGIHDPLTPLAAALATSCLLVGLVPWRVLGRQLPASIAPPQPAVVPPPRSVVAPGARQPPLVLDDVTVTHAGARAPALRVPALVVAAGEMLLVSGDSGSGKSTLLDVISGVGEAVAATVVRGRVARAGTVAVVAQDPQRQAVLDLVAEDVAFALRNDGVPAGDLDRRVVAALDSLGCLHLARRRCSTLSGGELQRVMLAAAIAREPDLLVLDEPAAQLDAETMHRFWRLVAAERQRRGMAVVVAEHRALDACVAPDRVVEVRDGQVVPVGEAAADEALARCAPHAALAAPPRLAVAGLGVRTAAGATVVDDLVLALHPGELLAVTGANGSGKTTLLRALRGLHPATGSIRIDGRPPAGVEAAAATVAWVGQHAGSLVFAPTVHGQARALAGRYTARVELALADAGLASRAAAHPVDLSIGQRQRLAIVSATLRCQPLWLLDEPTRGLDHRARTWLAHHVARHLAAGGVVVVATHDSAFVGALASQVLELGVRARPAPWRLVAPAPRTRHVPAAADHSPASSPAQPSAGEVHT